MTSEGPFQTQTSCQNAICGLNKQIYYQPFSGVCPSLRSHQIIEKSDKLWVLLHWGPTKLHFPFIRFLFFYLTSKIPAQENETIVESCSISNSCSLGDVVRPHASWKHVVLWAHSLMGPERALTIQLTRGPLTAADHKCFTCSTSNC